VRRDGETVRLFTRRGYDWTDRYPALAAAATKLRAKSFTLDGEAVVAGADGVAVRAATPLDALKAFVEVFGCPVKIGDKKSLFTEADTFPLGTEVSHSGEPNGDRFQIGSRIGFPSF
jgi:hypothetical protein